MSTLNRRDFLALAAALGASAVFGCSLPRSSRLRWRERRDLFPEGVASGDPTPDGVLLWTRYPSTGDRAGLTVEVAEDDGFERVVASAAVVVLAETDWTCRALVDGLRPRTTYWYRFVDGDGNGSRIGRTRTAPAEDDPDPVCFTFVSCQNANQGAQNAYRRMIFEDERTAEAEQLAFVLHLGDFIYELVWYPEEHPKGLYDRRLRDIVRYENGQKIGDFYIPTSLGDYRAVYRAYLDDPDLQDARARWPFVNIWDNHEFSWQGWQSFLRFGDTSVPSPTRKVAANQAWFEYLPSRVARAGITLRERFDAPSVTDTPVERFDDHGLGQEANNLAAINSLTAYRSFRYGKHFELFITDQHSYRSEEPTGRPEAKVFASVKLPELLPESVVEILDAGRAYGSGQPPATIHFGAAQVPNFRRTEPPQTILGAEQKAWFLNRLRASKATWKVWGNSAGTLDFRADPQNLPAELTAAWPHAGYACSGGGDYSTAYLERAEIYDVVSEAGITGFVTVSGDRHSFWAGFAAKQLPPKSFEPVGVAFITGSISAPGIVEAFEHRFPKNSPVRPLFLADRPGEAKPHPALNLLLHHGVRACFEYQRTGDVERARALSNPDLSPHLRFVDMAGHGYATVRLSSERVDCEFVCIPRPLERADTADGGPLRYRVSHTAKLWKQGEQPELQQTVIEGDPLLAI